MTVSPETISTSVRPRPIVREFAAYSVPRAKAGVIDLWLDSNEGAQPPPAALESLRALDLERIRRYPDKRRLERLIADRFALDPECVILTAGGDDAIDRCCRAMIEPGRETIIPSPTFEMIERSAKIAGGKVIEVPWWRGEFPESELIGKVSPRTALIALVTPNNPTGAVIPPATIERIARAAPAALLLIDLAYIEFANEDITLAVLRLPNAVIVRTFSKALGCAGLRAGYALGEPEIIDWLRAVSGPYPTAGPSLAIIEALLESGARDDEYFNQVGQERIALTRLAAEVQAFSHPSQANFVLIDVNDAVALRDAMADRGIAVRAFPGHPALGNSVRITCPGSASVFARLERALRDAIKEIEE